MTNKPNLIELFNEIHDIDKHIELVNREATSIRAVMCRLSNKAKTEEEYIRLDMAFERDKDLLDVQNELNQRRDKLWVDICKLIK